ncbi:polyhomeotic-like protein 1 [Anoplopoma fimbria]|uniref:polyhomeotic-like protein 1 n=1 Tax=Anoplopoma fimbria TaxID=229290 RepID=UPI0023EDB18C|nr:polyhomeotic-like protein 1 [Anoplopoma fimbria]
METDGEQNQQGASTNGSTASGTSSRPSPMNSMSLYERQAVALQALQRQPNAAQYFQQLMLQQQISNAQFQNLAAVQQVKATLAASRQSSPSSSGSSQTTSTTAASVTSGSTTSSRPMGAPATSTISQSVLLSGTAGGQGQMYLRVNRSLRAPISSQLIFMPGNTAAATVATVTQQPQAQQQQQQEVTPTSSSGGHSDNDQVQNLAMRGVSGPKGVKTEAPERSDSAAYSLVQPSHQSISHSSTKPNQHHHQPPHIKIPTYPQPTNLKAHPSSSSSSTSSTSSIPLSQLLLHGTRTLTTGSTAPTAAHTLVLTSGAASQGHGYPVGTATIKPAVNAQTLVVQPLQKTSLGAEKSGHGNGPVPIQPKTLQGLRLPLQLPSRNPPPILPAPPPVSSSSAQPAQPPHIPVQIVGARQSTLGNAQALALARGSCCQDGAAAVLSSSSSLLTMVASIASREGGVVGRGVGLKTLQSPQEAPPLAQVSQVHPQANQSTGPSQNGPVVSNPASSQATVVSSPPSSMSRSSLSLPLVTEEQRGASTAVTTNGDSSRSQTAQVKQLTGSLKRKSDSTSANDEDGPSPPRLQPIRDHVSAVPTNPREAGPGAPPPVSSSPSPLLSVSRGVGQGERAPPPQAVVKPNVLTHLIEGFVIQEGAEPFPVCGSVKDSTGEDLTNDSLDTNQSETVTTATVLKCEYCKNFAPASQFRGTKRFCSMTCAKSMYWFPRYNVSFRQHFCVRQGQGQGQGQGHGQLSNSDEDGGITRRRVPRRTSSEIASAKIAGRPIPVKCRSESSHSDEESSGEEDEDDPVSLSSASSASCRPPPPPLPTESSSPSCLPAGPAQWSVEEVSQFISSLQGCEELASQFLSQEIDGQALLLLKEEHLMSTMNIKLGPALKICAHINTLRD